MSSGIGVDNLSQGVSNISLESSDAGIWEEVSKNFKGKVNSGRHWVEWPQQSSAPQAWSQADTANILGISEGSVGSWPDTKHVTGKPVENLEKAVVKEAEYSDYDDDDDDYLLSDGSDSDEEPVTYETMKKHRLLKKFFESFDALTIQEINEPERQWHCPACQNGPCSIYWYKGLQPLMTHARTKGTIRMKLHRKFADILEDDLKKRGFSMVPAGEANQAVRERTKMLQIENKEEKDYQENFFKEQIQQIHAVTNAKEDLFEKLQDEERLKIEEFEALASNKEELLRRSEELSKLKQLQDEEIGKFEGRREQLIQSHEVKKMEMKKRHFQEGLDQEREFNAAYTELIAEFIRPTEPAAGSA